MRTTTDRIPSLDGARALAILLVIVDHLDANRPIWVDFGNLGVRTFFVISGFLITYLLLQEAQRTNSISLRNFYLRRLLRIVPAYYVFLAIVALLIPTGLVFATYTDLLPALAYYSNYHSNYYPEGWTLGMTWSLSVEEQFYVLWPTALVLLGLGRAKGVCIAILLIAPLFRLLSDLHWWPTRYPRFAFECVSDALATGCLLAIFRDRLWSWSMYRRAIESGLALLPLGLGLFTIDQFNPIYRDTIGIPLMNISLAVMLDRCMRFPTQGLARGLNWGPIAWIGTISYSLYLWQSIFTGLVNLPPLVKFGGMFTLAAISYYAIERPARLAARRLQTASPCRIMADSGLANINLQLRALPPP